MKSDKQGQSQKKTKVIRFRVTEDEMEIIQRAATNDGAELQAEYEKRGLGWAGGSTAALRSPPEWCRQAIMDIAIKKLRERMIQLPWERRREEERARLREERAEMDREFATYGDPPDELD
jgi:hypothetical protein